MAADELGDEGKAELRVAIGRKSRKRKTVERERPSRASTGYLERVDCSFTGRWIIARSALLRDADGVVVDGREKYR